LNYYHEKKVAKQKLNKNNEKTLLKIHLKKKNGGLEDSYLPILR
jgi:hypothetical protein